MLPARRPRNGYHFGELETYRRPRRKHQYEGCRVRGNERCGCARLARAITKSEASISAAIGYVCKGIHRRDAHATAPTAKHKKATPTAAQIAEKHTAQAQAKVARGLAAVAKAEKKTAKQVAKLVKTDERAHREAKPAKAKKARQTKATKPKRQAAKLARPAKKKAHRLEKAPF